MTRRLTVLGGGNMGRALVGGLLRSGTRAEQLAVGESDAATRELIEREFGVTASADNAIAIAGAEVLVLAVKPQEAAAVMTPLAALLAATRPLVVSVLAGTRIATLEGWCGSGVPVVRAMPNRPALLGAGVTGLYAPLKVGAEKRARAEQILRAVGEVIVVPSEDQLDIVTAVSGSGPAYFFLLAELMAEAGSELGLGYQAAQRLAAATLYGAGLMAQQGGAELARLRAEVTSRGGTTEAAVAVLTQADLRATVARAVAAAAARSRELAAAPKT